MHPFANLTRPRFGRRGRGLVLALAAALGCAPAQAAGDQTSPLIILESIEVRAGDGTVIVDIEADGPLPVPATGRLDAPARFYLDFAGVITGTRGPRAGLAPVTRVRVALNSSNPPVTRVVLDLAAPHAIAIDDSARARGRLRVVVGSPLDETVPPPATAAEPEASPPPHVPPAPALVHRPVNPAQAPGLLPVPPLPEPVAARAAGSAAPADPDPAGPPDTRAPTETLPAGTAPPPRKAPEEAPDPARDLPAPAVYSAGSGAPPPKPSEKDLGRYRGDVQAPLTRMRRLRPLLSEIDRRDATPPAGLQEARAELSAAIRSLSRLDPPAALERTHDMLLRAASLSMMAATLRADAGTRADPTVVRNAGSAAAGALLLLDRVCIEIGCEPLPDSK